MRPEIQSFDEGTLKKMVFCAVLMSAIDGDIHQKEWAVIQEFVHQYWRNNFESFNDYRKVLVIELKRILADQELLQAKLEEILRELGEKLSPPKKRTLLDFVGNVMAADQVMTVDESDLFARFIEKIGIQS